MVHYKCARCKAIIQAPEDQRGHEHTCPHCATVNIVPGGATHRHHLYKDVSAATHHEEAEEVKEPITAGKVIKTLLWGALAAVSVTAVLLAIYYRPHNPTAAMVEALVPSLDEYCQIVPKDPPAGHTPGPYVVGKAALVNFLDAKTIRTIEANREKSRPNASEQPDGSWRGMNWREFCRLPESIRATTPEEVQTLVWLKWSLESYTEGEPKQTRYRVLCDVTVIDMNDGIVVAKASFRGPRPIQPDLGPPEICGPRPSSDIIEYLTNAPRYRRDKWGLMVPVPKDGE